jgi:glutathione synthase/RimK-type ligase-like ATP-grasp enzyme
MRDNSRNGSVVPSDEGSRIAEIEGIPIYKKVSAKTGANIDELVMTLCQQMYGKHLM